MSDLQIQEARCAALGGDKAALDRLLALWLQTHGRPSTPGFPWTVLEKVFVHPGAILSVVFNTPWMHVVYVSGLSFRASPQRLETEGRIDGKVSVLWLPFNRVSEFSLASIASGGVHWFESVLRLPRASAVRVEITNNSGDVLAGELALVGSYSDEPWSQS